MEWKCFKDEKPARGKLVVVFQYKRKRYIVARKGFYRPSGHKYIRVDEKEAINASTYESGQPTWFSESGNRLKPNDEDMWMYLEPVTFTKTYA